jgi:thioesterase domain-containing protein
MVRFIAIGMAALWLSGCSYGGGISALSFSAAQRPPAEKLPGRAYLLRGLIGDIYSLGMDELAEKIEQRGVKASVYGVSAIAYLANRIIRDYRTDPAGMTPIILIGHSTGGDAIISIAERLKAADVPVALAVGFDPTRIASRVPSNVDLFINLYQGTNIIGGGAVHPGADFGGRIVNVDLRERREIIHITLDKNDAIHELILRKIGALAEQARAVRNAAAVPVPDAHSSAKNRRKPAHKPGAPDEPVYVAPMVIRYVVPPKQTIELWDSAINVKADANESVEQVAQRTGAPAWAIAQINKVDPDQPLREGQRLLIPRNRLVLPSDLPSEKEGLRR